MGRKKTRRLPASPGRNRTQKRLEKRRAADRGLRNGRRFEDQARVIPYQRRAQRLAHRRPRPRPTAAPSSARRARLLRLRIGHGAKRALGVDRPAEPAHRAARLPRRPKKARAGRRLERRPEAREMPSSGTKWQIAAPTRPWKLRKGLAAERSATNAPLSLRRFVSAQALEFFGSSDVVRQPLPEAGAAASRSPGLAEQASAAVMQWVRHRIVGADQLRKRAINFRAPARRNSAFSSGSDR